MTDKTHPGIEKGLVVDGFAIFDGYASPLEEGQEPALTKDDAVRIVRFEGDEDIVVVKVDEDGNEVKDDDGNPIAERLFAQELTPAEMDDDEASEEEVEGEADEVEEAEADAEEETAEADETDEVEEAEADDKPLAGKTFKADASIAELRAVATDNGQKATGRSTDDVKASLIEMGAEEVEAEAAEEEQTEAATEEAPKEPAKRKAPAAKKPAKKKADAKETPVKTTEVVEISDMASVTEAISGEGGDALKAAKSLVERAERTNFTLGGVLRNINETGVFKTLGYEGKRGFDDYVEQTLNIAPRKARYLMGIYEAFAMLGIADVEERLEAIGWSKAKEMARIPSAELKRDFTKLEKRATDGTRDSLVEHIKTKYTVATRNTGDQVKLSTFTFKLAEEDATTATEALAAAAKLTGEGADNLNAAFLYVCGEFQNAGAGQDLDLEQALELLGSRFGAASITLVDENGDKVEWTPDEDAAEASEEEETLPATEEA